MQTFILAVVAILLVILFVWLLLREQGERTAGEPVAGKKPVEVETWAAEPAAKQVAPAAAPQVVVEPEQTPIPVISAETSAAQPAAAQPDVVAEAAVEAPTPVIAAAPPVIDDLEIIEGIGPKIASVLQQVGITSFAQLAAMEPARISEILHAANLRLADPKTWPEQARLAATGDQAGLKALQDQLKGGREA